MVSEGNEEHDVGHWKKDLIKKWQKDMTESFSIVMKIIIIQWMLLLILYYYYY